MFCLGGAVRRQLRASCQKRTARLQKDDSVATKALGEPSFDSNAAVRYQFAQTTVPVLGRGRYGKLCHAAWRYGFSESLDRRALLERRRGNDLETK